MPTDEHGIDVLIKLMCDPVRLPGSQYVVDRVNIKRHLLND
jgi:hypothetical protein